jgi:hypothetical protein
MTTTAPDQPEPDIARATPRGRILLACGFLFALAMVSAFRFYVLPLLQSVVATAPRADAVVAVKLVFAGIATIGTLLAVGWLLYGRAIVRSRQYPPPRAWLWRDTKIIRGAPAVRRGRWSIAAAIATALLCIGLALYITITIDRLAARTKLPPNVTIVNEKTAPAQ